MKSPNSKAEKITKLLKNELNNPKLNLVKKTFIVEKIKLLSDFIIRKKR